MFHTRQKARKYLLLVVALVASFSVNAGLFGFGADSWKEEVLLHDGQKIIVERAQTYGGRSEPGQSDSGPIKEHTIHFTLPSTNQSVLWSSEYSEDAGRTNLNLLALHVLNGVPYVVAEPNLCISYNKWGRPNPPYVFFKYEGNVWQRIPLEEFPAEFKTINVAYNTLGNDARSLVRLGFVSAEKLKELFHSSSPVYQEIMRRQLNPEPCPQYPSGPKAPLLIPSNISQQ